MRTCHFVGFVVLWLNYIIIICLELQLTSQGQKSSLGVKGFNFLLHSQYTPLIDNYYYKICFFLLKTI